MNPETYVQFEFNGKGWGHGVGLCQVGAYGMAQAGADYKENLKKILPRYYHRENLLITGASCSILIESPRSVFPFSSDGQGHRQASPFDHLVLVKMIASFYPASSQNSHQSQSWKFFLFLIASCIFTDDWIEFLSL